MIDQAKSIYPIYKQLLERFHLGFVSCDELGSSHASTDLEAQRRIERWFHAADERIEVPHIREFLNQAALSEEGLRGLLARHLGKELKDRRDRDKIDFLLVQYLAECLPANVSAQELSLAQAAEVLKPVLGGNNTPKRLAELEECIRDLDQCFTLSDFVDRWVLERGHAIKIAAQEKPFDSFTLVAFARFSFLMRLGAIRVLYEDLRALEEDLQELETRGVREVDGISPDTAKKAPVGHIRKLCEKWKHYFPGKYSQNQWFTDVISVRRGVKQTLEETSNRTQSESARNGTAAKKRAKAGAQNPVSHIGPAPVQGTQLQAEVERYMREIAEQVQSPIGGRASSVTAIDLAGLRLMLSTGEVDAFQEPCEGMNLALQRAVAVRAILLAALDKNKPDVIDLRAAVELAQAEAMALQQQIVVAKNAGDMDAAVNLRACDRSLRKALEKMDKNLLSGPEESLPATQPQQKRSKQAEHG